MKWTFISKPRCASNSLHDYFATGRKYNHMAIHRIPKSERGFTFAVVRNPFTLLVSWFTFHKRFQPQHTQYHCTFKEWVRKGCPAHWSEGMRKELGVQNPLMQYEYLLDENGKDGCKVLIRYESLGSDVNYIAKFLGITPKFDRIPKHLPSGKNPVHNYYDDETIENVSDLFNLDFEQFNYEPKLPRIE